MTWYDDIRNDDDEHGRIERLLATVVDGEGTANLPEAPYSRPFATSTFRGGLPEGETMFDFSEGTATAHNTVVSTEFSSLRDISRELDTTTAGFRAVAVQPDDDVRVKVEGGDYYHCQGNETTVIQSANFDNIWVDCYRTSVVTLTALTRADGYTASGANGYCERHNAYQDGSNVVIKWYPPDGYDTDWADKFGWSDSVPLRNYERATIKFNHLGVLSGEDATITVSSAPASDLADHGPTASADNLTETITTQTLSAGNDMKVVVDEPHSLIQADFESAMGGDVRIEARYIAH